MINCLITGSTGFVGSNLLFHFSSNEKINIVKLDLRNIDNIQIPDSINCVIHLVGKAHDLKYIKDPSEYYFVNFELTKNVFDAFLVSNADIFITLSSVKAVVDFIDTVLTEDTIPNPKTHYGISKLNSEIYITQKALESNKKYFILRPSLIHGPGNKGNFNLLYKFLKYRIPWFLGKFHNKRSFCSIENLSFVITELITNKNIPSGIYNVVDDEPISTNELIQLISEATNINTYIISLPKNFIYLLAKIGKLFSLPINTENLEKLTENFVVSNFKLKQAIKKDLPIQTRKGLLNTFKSFKENNNNN